MNVFKKLKAYLQLREAVIRADEAHEQTGERFYVMPMSGDKPKVVIMDRRNFRKLKQKGYITRKANVHNLEMECFYFTPYRNGSGVITPEAKNVKTKGYYQWYESCLKQRKINKFNGVQSK